MQVKVQTKRLGMSLNLSHISPINSNHFTPLGEEEAKSNGDPSMSMEDGLGKQVGYNSKNQLPEGKDEESKKQTTKKGPGSSIPPKGGHS